MQADKIELILLQQRVAGRHHRLLEVKFLFQLLLKPQIFVVVIVDGDSDDALLAAALQQTADGGAIYPQLAGNLRLVISCS